MEFFIFMIVSNAPPAAVKPVSRPGRRIEALPNVMETPARH
jgi:hypothetical protein